jgi:hypothetical protein
MNVAELMAARCAVAAVERNGLEARSAVRAARYKPDAEWCSTDELGRSGAEKRSRRHLMKNYRSRNSPMNPENSECDSDMRS